MDSRTSLVGIDTSGLKRKCSDTNDDKFPQSSRNKRPRYNTDENTNPNIQHAYVCSTCNDTSGSVFRITDKCCQLCCQANFDNVSDEFIAFMAPMAHYTDRCNSCSDKYNAAFCVPSPPSDKAFAFLATLDTSSCSSSDTELAMSVPPSKRITSSTDKQGSAWSGYQGMPQSAMNNTGTARQRPKSQGSRSQGRRGYNKRHVTTAGRGMGNYTDRSRSRSREPIDQIDPSDITQLQAVSAIEMPWIPSQTWIAEYKTVACRYWAKGFCRYRNNCNFMHGDEEWGQLTDRPPTGSLDGEGRAKWTKDKVEEQIQRMLKVGTTPGPDGTAPLDALKEEYLDPQLEADMKRVMRKERELGSLDLYENRHQNRPSKHFVIKKPIPAETRPRCDILKEIADNATDDIKNPMINADIRTFASLHDEDLPDEHQEYNRRYGDTEGKVGCDTTYPRVFLSCTESFFDRRLWLSGVLNTGTDYIKQRARMMMLVAQTKIAEGADYHPIMMQQNEEYMRIAARHQDTYHEDADVMHLPKTMNKKEQIKAETNRRIMGEHGRHKCEKKSKDKFSKNGKITLPEAFRLINEERNARKLDPITLEDVISSMLSTGAALRDDNEANDTCTEETRPQHVWSAEKNRIQYCFSTDLAMGPD